ncbi:MAG: hypothetical protein GX796_02125 [Clostridiaceae bacterium]|nr:hypothetical protein [Clostridiaceae bacterium]
MRLTSIAVIFVIIISPFIFISGQETKAAIQDQRLRYYYDNFIDNAIGDAAFILSNKGSGFTYSCNMDISDTKELAAKAFFDSLYYAFNAKGNQSLMARVDACIPVLAFLENEGFSLYALDEYKNINGQSEISHVWFPFRHFIGEPISGRYNIRYTLEDKVYIFDYTEQSLEEGEYSDFKDVIPYFQEKQAFEDLRISAVKNSVQEGIMAYMNYHNQWTMGRSLSVKLEFPSIDEADWKRALIDEGIIVFAQGFPIISGKSYKHYALGGARVIRKAPITGYTYQDILYYCKTNCEHLQSNVLIDPGFDQDSVIYYSDAYEAASSGYYPCPFCLP